MRLPACWPSVLALPSRPSRNRKNIGYLYESQSFGVRDSQLLTLLHEVIHFHNVASSIDHFPGVNSASRNFADVKARMNTDGLAAYILAIA